VKSNLPKGSLLMYIAGKLRFNTVLREIGL
jgi:hypothetical protein